MSLSEVIAAAASVAFLFASYLLFRRGEAASRSRSSAFLAFSLAFAAVSALFTPQQSPSFDFPAALPVLLGSGLVLVALALGAALPQTPSGRRALDELRRLEQRLEAIFRNGADAMLLCTPDGVIVDSNLAAEAIMRRGREEVRGTPLASLLDVLDDRPDRIAQSFRERMSGELAGRREYRVKMEDRRLWLEVESRPVTTKRETLLLVCSRDITARKLAEEAIRRDGVRWSLLVDSVPAFAWTTDSKLRVTGARGKGLATLGLSAEEVEGKTLPWIYSKLGLEIPREPLHERALRGEVVPISWRLRDHIFEGALVGIPDGTSGAMQVAGIALDVTDRERAVSEAESTERTLYSILQQAPALVFLKDLQGRYVWTNRRYERASGRSLDEMVGRTDFELFPEPYAATYVANDREVLATGEAKTYVETGIGQRGLHHFYATKFVLRDEQGRITGLCGISTDETDRVTKEKELEHREALLDEAQSMARLAYFEWDLRTGVHTWSPALYEFYGVEPASSPAETLATRIYEEDRARVVEEVQATVQDGAPYDTEYRIRRVDGEIRWLRVKGEMELDAAGERQRFFGIVRDVTDAKLARERVQGLTAELEAHVQRRTAELSRAVAELDSFSYAVSHDLRQPLRTINGYLSLMRADGGTLDDRSRGYLELVGNAVRRMQGIIADLLALSRVSHAKLDRRELDLTAAVNRIAGEIAASDRPRRVEWLVEAGMQVTADAGLLELLLRNLLGNAFKFTRSTDPARIEVGSEEREGERWFFVRDNGAGFEPEQAERLFEPFRRLHGAGEYEGNGVGLATVARIVERHGGRVAAEGLPDEGATISWTMPPGRELPADGVAESS